MSQRYIQLFIDSDDPEDDYDLTASLELLTTVLQNAGHPFRLVATEYGDDDVIYHSRG